MLAPGLASTICMKGKADVVVMFLDRNFAGISSQADDKAPDDCLELGLLDFHAALARTLVAFGLSRRRAADAFALAAAEAVRGIGLHRAVASHGPHRGGLSPHAGRAVDAAIQRWLDGGEGMPRRLRTLANHAGLSPSHFLRGFSTETGSTPGKAVQTQRLREALRLLLGSDIPVGEIGERHRRFQASAGRNAGTCSQRRPECAVELRRISAII